MIFPSTALTATVAGLVAHFGTLGDDEQDDQATLSREDAVTVGTLHGAKGLEWEIPSPPPTENFEAIPVIDHPPYNYAPEPEVQLG